MGLFTVTTIREALFSQPGSERHSLAWRTVVRLARRWNSEMGPLRLRRRSPIDRMLQRDVKRVDNLEHLGAMLLAVIDALDEPSQKNSLMAIEKWFTQNTPKTVRGPVKLTVAIPGLTVGEEQIDVWLNTVAGRANLAPAEAARWVHHLDGRDVGGRRVTVEVALKHGEELPKVSRNDRMRRPTRNRQCWLPHIDHEAHYSATPRSVAQQHAKLFSGLQVVFDPHCGAGGDAIAMAQAGLRVVASDINPDRLEIARRNAVHFGVNDAIEFHCGDAVSVGREHGVTHADAGLFLDPPWGGVDWKASEAHHRQFLESIAAPMRAFAYSRCVLKLPRTFDLTSLPEFPSGWNVYLGLDVEMTEPVDRLKTLAAVLVRD